MIDCSARRCASCGARKYDSGGRVDHPWRYCGGGRAYAFSQLRFRGKELLFLACIGLLLIPSTLTLIPLFLTIQKLHFFNTWWALILPYAATAQPLLVLMQRPATIASPPAVGAPAGVCMAYRPVSRRAGSQAWLRGW